MDFPAPPKMPLQIPVGAFLYQNVPTFCENLARHIKKAWRHTVPILKKHLGLSPSAYPKHPAAGHRGPSTCTQ